VAGLAVPAKLVVPAKMVAIVGAIYLFIVGVSGMGEAFGLFGRGFAEAVLDATGNPITGLFLGILATSLVQSSSTSTSIIVGMVAGGVITLEGAIPMIMGANIGTSITAMLVSIGHINRPAEFQRAFGAASSHMIFNLMAVVLLFPIEMATGMLATISTLAANLFENAGGMRLSNPLKAATAPMIKLLTAAVFGQAWLLLVVTVLLTFTMLVTIVKLLRSMVLAKVEVLFDRHIFRTWPRAMLFGLVLTVVVQTSSIPTSLVVPLAAAGVIKLGQVYPFNLGSNLGTTLTAVLAALATGNEVAITVAFSHVLFNIIGILAICAVPVIRRLPMRLAERLAVVGTRHRAVAVGVIFGVYFIVPLIFVAASRLWSHLIG